MQRRWSTALRTSRCSRCPSRTRSLRETTIHFEMEVAPSPIHGIRVSTTTLWLQAVVFSGVFFSRLTLGEDAEFEATAADDM